jgi:hypothetical protein
MRDSRQDKYGAQEQFVLTHLTHVVNIPIANKLSDTVLYQRVEGC